MTCAKCQHVESNAWALGQHWKTAHPVEFKKRQQAKKKAKRAESGSMTIDVPTANELPDGDQTDPEQTLIAETVYQFRLAFDGGMTDAGAARVLEYLRDRFATRLPQPMLHTNGVRQQSGIL